MFSQLLIRACLLLAIMTAVTHAFIIYRSAPSYPPYYVRPSVYHTGFGGPVVYYGDGYDSYDSFNFNS
ncbi:hypothetical protein DPMN_168729 [Dreissena polymorpha]|uniref:Uncharacterized protein n=1 Tax=Dreissena polymorpha TaxID=45954 RepID=A0A9D4F2E2_DREPO|nr:hypothetical protein DPMN_168729 [Dreissena polymorpha]